MTSRNTDIQEEYARMLQELDDQAELLDEEIRKEREGTADRAKRRHEEAVERKARKKQYLGEQSAQLRAQLDKFTLEIRHQQRVFATLEEENENQEDEIDRDDVQSAEERRQLEEERAQNEIVELQQEIVLLKEVQKATVEKIDVWMSEICDKYHQCLRKELIVWCVADTCVRRNHSRCNTRKKSTKRWRN